jgi:putative addiction module component (TIGR02574 family)
VTSTARKILEEAFALSEPERETLVDALAESLSPPETGLSPEWRREVDARLAALESGAEQPVPWSEVAARIERTLKGA